MTDGFPTALRANRSSALVLVIALRVCHNPVLRRLSKRQNGSSWFLACGFPSKFDLFYILYNFREGFLANERH